MFGMLACSYAWRACMLVCLRAWHARVLTCSCVWRAFVLACLSVPVPKTLACFMTLHAHMPRMLSVFKISYMLRWVWAWCPRFSRLLYIWKVRFQKSLYRKIWFLIRGVFKTHLIIHDEIFLRKKLMAKSH